LCENNDEKLEWMKKNLPKLIDEGQILVFVNKIKSVFDVAQQIDTICTKEVLHLHGDMAH